MEALLLTRDFETRLHVHYHLLGYWVDESAPRENSRSSKRLSHIKGVVANE